MNETLTGGELQPAIDALVFLLHLYWIIMRPFTSSGCTHHRAFMPVFVHHSDPPSMTSGCLYRVGSIHTHTQTKTHTHTTTYTLANRTCRQIDKHTHSHMINTYQHAYRTHIQTQIASWWLVTVSKRVGSKHWPPYPCKALRLLALMKPLMGSYLNPWMEVTAVWGGAISVDATHTNGQCHIWGEDCVQLALLNKVELHVQFSSTHTAQHTMYCLQLKSSAHLGPTRIHLIQRYTHSKLVCILKNLETRALVCNSKYEA